ncbi:conserved hypothetical protein [Desulfatibacillum aliphaticivorans]|uniref:ATPase associated with various cellular activities AAA_5 n=1 Tax=Desulfatibacillum aliphaticivorans TaxID=218208 RepID=B8FGP8_DESAL|nr:hypothetical protein [Desulfatibacillum aliphaticivorans]ACL05278.1 conserved hypothetical protein [Desulfatibacillum aliphaticivorans]
MRKEPVAVTVPELQEILERHLAADAAINYAVKIVGHPGIGKSDLVRQTAAKMNFLFIDTRLAFKENIDLGGYPVPDHESRRMLYYRPGFIPPPEVPEGKDGILWFLDEANRAHPTVIQTLFQIITEKVCGEHALPDKTFVVLAGNLGEEDNTALTEFDDSALDGRLAVFHLRPDAPNWLNWGEKEGIHPSIIRYIGGFPDKLWDEENIHPNPRGWHQVSQALRLSYGLKTEADLARLLQSGADAPLEKMIVALVGQTAASDFVLQITSPRELTTQEVLDGNQAKLDLLEQNRISQEDALWALSGALTALREQNMESGSEPSQALLQSLGNTLQFLALVRADMRLSFFYLLIKKCALFTQIPSALKMLEAQTADAVSEKIRDMLEAS